MKFICCLLQRYTMYVASLNISAYRINIQSAPLLLLLFKIAHYTTVEVLNKVYHLPQRIIPTEYKRRALGTKHIFSICTNRIDMLLQRK